MLQLTDIDFVLKKEPTLPLEGRWTPINDVKIIRHLSKQTNGNILEIGCHTGITTLELLDANPTKHVYAVDYTGNLPTVVKEQAYEIPTEIGKFIKNEQRVTLYDIRSAEFPYTKEMDIRFIFIDGDHSYNGVKTDTERALEYFKSNHINGMIVWHDYSETHPSWVQVKRYVDELSKTYDINVYKDTWVASLVIQ